MKRSSIISLVAVLLIFLLGVYYFFGLHYDLYIFLVILLLIPLILWRKHGGKDEAKIKSETASRLTIEEAEAKYGEPDGSIVVDATRANEAEGIILVYKSRRLLLVAGEPVSMDDITDVHSVNMATPYTQAEYQVVLTTRNADRRYIRLATGMDADWSTGVAQGILDAMAEA